MLSTSLLCCKKEDSIKPLSQATTKDVYVVGCVMNSNYVNVATVWKNGINTFLTDGTQDSEANDISIFKKNIYVVGYQTLNQVSVATIWKNGISTKLSDGVNNEVAKGIAIVGEDIYVVGYQEINFALKPKIWKNGIATYLEVANELFSETPTNIYVSGNSVYVCGWRSNGTESFAKFWKNGVPVNLSNGQTSASANDILVLDSDVYVVGRDNYKAKCWENNVSNTTLVMEEDGYEAKKIVAVGSDIYILGYQFFNEVHQIRLWVNGNAIDFQNPSDDVFPLDIAINEDDNYVCGNQYSGDKTHAIYYKNQVKVDLVNDTIINSEANAIFVN